MHRIVTLAPLALVTLAIPSSAADKDFLAGRVAGKPVNCIDPQMNNGPTIIDADTILYNANGRRLYRTGPVGKCPSLRPMTTLIVEIRSGQLCRNDLFRVLEPGTTIPSAYCRFRDFTPYEKPKKP